MNDPRYDAFVASLSKDLKPEHMGAVFKFDPKLGEAVAREQRRAEFSAGFRAAAPAPKPDPAAAAALAAEVKALLGLESAEPKPGPKVSFADVHDPEADRRSLDEALVEKDSPLRRMVAFTDTGRKYLADLDAKHAR